VLAGVIGTRQHYGERASALHPPAQMDTATWKIRNFQTVSNKETINMKVVDPNKLWNFVVYTFSFEIILSMKIKFEYLKFEIQIS
jgi:hypothetical protein